MQFNAPLDVSNNDGRVPRSVAQAEGHTSTVSLLAKHASRGEIVSPRAPAATATVVDATPVSPPPPEGPAPPLLRINTNDNGLTSSEKKFFRAAKSGDDETVKTLLAEALVQVDARDQSRNTALHFACREVSRAACARAPTAHSALCRTARRATSTASSG